MMIIYDDHIWWSYVMIICDHHIWSSYMIILHDDHIWSSYMIIIRGLVWFGLVWDGLGQTRSRKIHENKEKSIKYQTSHPPPRRKSCVHLVRSFCTEQNHINRLPRPVLQGCCSNSQNKQNCGGGILGVVWCGFVEILNTQVLKPQKFLSNKQHVDFFHANFSRRFSLARSGRWFFS